ncbi:MAG: hypothetical protein LBR95_05665, partial [Azoarcus sp.]|nr:hypothetical protein [Azoarcus sp.]
MNEAEGRKAKSGLCEQVPSALSPYSAVSNLGNTRPIIVIARAARRGNPDGRVDCHVASLLAMTALEEMALKARIGVSLRTPTFRHDRAC